MKIDVGIATPPQRKEAVAELRVHHEGGGLSIPAEIFREDGKLMPAIYGLQGGIEWEFRIADFLIALGRGVEIMEK
ncbi:MAG: hypothetical protein WBH47_19500 [Streptosporangiaceae bacterium]